MEDPQVHQKGGDDIESKQTGGLRQFLGWVLCAAAAALYLLQPEALTG